MNRHSKRASAIGVETPRNRLVIVKSKLRMSDLRDGMKLDDPGIMFFGWWKTNPPFIGDFAGFAECWPHDSATFKYYEFHSDHPHGGHQIEVDVRILRYPGEWIETIEKSLKHFVSSGASVAWAGGYECFTWYRPGCDFAGCYAAYTSNTGLVCLGGLDDPFRYINEDRKLIRELNSAVTADVR